MTVIAIIVQAFLMILNVLIMRLSIYPVIRVMAAVVALLLALLIGGELAVILV